MISIFILVPLVIGSSTVKVNIDYCVDYSEVSFNEYTERDLKLLARLVYCEARGEVRLGKIAVAQVVLNRVKRDSSTIYKVVHRRGQFDGIHTKQFYRYNQECLEAARVALQGYKVLPEDIYYFYNPVTSTDTKWIAKLKDYQVIGNHNFARYVGRTSGDTA